MIQNYKRNKALRLIAARVETALSGKEKKLQLNRRELILVKWCLEKAIPQRVVEHTADWQWCYCPSCHSILDHEYIRNCDCCGQNLSWYGSRKYAVVLTKDRSGRLG